MKWLLGIVTVMVIMHYFVRRAGHAAQAEGDARRRRQLDPPQR